MTRALRLALLLGAPTLLIVIGELSAGGSVPSPASPESLRLRARTEERLGLVFASLTTEAGRIAGIALASLDEAQRQAEVGPLAGRLEGVGIVAEGDLLDWKGTPAEPIQADEGDGPAYSVAVDGLWARLLVRSAPDPEGVRGLASFLLDAPTLGHHVHDLFPRDLDRAVFHAVLFDPLAPHPRATSEEHALDFALLAPDGTELAVVAVEIVPPAAGRERRAWGRAAAAGAFVLLLLALFDWRARTTTATGLLVALLAVAVARAALHLARVPALLPREIGSPSLYGSPEGWGLLGSPADLVLTTVGLLLVGLAIGRFVTSTDRRGVAIGTALVAAAVATGALLALSAFLARDARVFLLDLGRAARSPGQAVLLLGIGLALVGTAYLWSAVWSVFRSDATTTIRWTPGFLALIPLAAASSTILQLTTDRLAVDRLRSEFARTVLDQSSHRRVALLSAVREAAGAPRSIAALRAAGTDVDAYAAYRLWVAGDLFHTGYASSLDVYAADGTPLSHFGFDLPRLAEGVAPRGDDTGTPWIREEVLPVGSRQQALLHAEMPVMTNEGVLGTVVGHVVDEPGNLPFLPSFAPYLAALGPGVPRTIDDTARAPDYVLYDANGTVLVHTVAQPPAVTGEFFDAAEEGRTLRVAAGATRYIALPLVGEDVVHLLLWPSRTALGRLGGFVRLFLLGLGLGSVLAACPYLVRPGGASTLVRGLRRSFYRKLLASLMLASVLPLVLFALFLRGYIDRQGEAGLVEAAAGLVNTVQRVVADYAAVAEPGEELDDEILYWLRGVVGQEIHLYLDGRLAATSKPELFQSGLLPPRLPGEVVDGIIRDGLPYLVRRESLGPSRIPVAYASVDLPQYARESVVSVPLILQQQETARAVARVAEMLLLSTVLLGGLVAAAGTILARAESRPVRELVRATAKIAGGNYDTRLTARTRDEVADLVEGFNAMASALAAQRADLERRRDYIEALLRNATTGVVSTDATGRIVTFNPAAEALLGPESPRTGDRLTDVTSRNEALDPLRDALLKPVRGSGEPEEIDIVSPRGPRRLRLVRVELPDPTGDAPGTLVLLDDVTDLMRSNQLAAWAEMARAIAHEIKNPLTPIQLSTEHLSRLLLDRGVLPSPDVESCLETVRKQVDALREIASEFSAYAKLPALDRRPTNAADLLREILEPYRVGHPPGITIRERYEPCPMIAIDRKVFSRAIVNLVENALQAMPDGGTLTVSVSREGERTAVTVEDTGHGLEPAVRSRLFEPYFSTRSSGTGLGLAIVRRAVEAHDGSIEVASGGEGGTAFRILLAA